MTNKDLIDKDPVQKIKDLHDSRRSITLKELEDAGATNIPIEIGTHISLEDLKQNVIAKGLVDHGGSRFPSSRDWNMPDVKCSRRTCVANYSSKCTMPSLIEIGAKGCKGYHKRASGKKK